METYSLGTSQAFPGRSQNPLKSGPNGPNPFWAAFGLQEAPKSPQVTPKKRARHAPERPRVAQEPSARCLRCPNLCKIEPRGTQNEILARSS